ncbi:MAG: primosomal protein N' [Magnetococcus sp. DMHC-1]
MFAQVALPVPLRNLFTYEVPATLKAACQPGCLVLVPVGPASRVGVVWELSDTPVWQEGTIRPLLDVLGEGPFLNAELRRLLDWLARYYMQPIGSVVTTALPGHLGFHRKRRFLWQGKPVTGDLPPALLPLATALQTRKGGLTEETLARNFGRTGLQGRLRQLLERGLVAVEENWQPRHRTGATPPEVSSPLPSPTTQTGYSPVNDAPDCQGQPVNDTPDCQGQPVNDAPDCQGQPDMVRVATAQNGQDGMNGQGRTEQNGIPGSIPERGPPLNAGQVACVQELAAALAAGIYAPFLLEGVTGSGKTEVYFQAVERCLQQGRQALLLVPEIALTPQLVARYRARFQHTLAIFHSGMPDNKRFAYWQAIQGGEARVVIGARSAIFAPFVRLGLVVVDEEHDGSYKQEEGVPYHARDMAVVRSREVGAVLVLGSATPSLESLANVERGRYRHLTLSERATGAALPHMHRVDLKDPQVRETLASGQLLSGVLRQAITEEVTNGRQVLLFLNRRGYAPSLLCRRCGAAITCPNCSVALTLHKQRGGLLCHYCDHLRPITDICGVCGQMSMAHLGFGTEQLEEETRNSFPGIRVARMDRDTASGSGRLEEILEAFRTGSIQILVGTQMVAKGHHFPNLSLVGIVLAETSLWQPDFRSAERTFQLVTQVAGRAGRDRIPGRVMIQTYDPAHYALQAAANHDLSSFVATEKEFRREAGYPPFRRLILVRFSTPVQEEGERFRRHLKETLAGEQEARILGPAPAPLFKLRGWFRWHVLLKETDTGSLHAAARRLLTQAGKLTGGTRIRLEVDVDPYSFF